MSSCVVMSKSQLQLGLPEKQGIVSILSPSAASLRRTLSADMSSKTWLSLNGLISPSPSPSPIKKIASFCNSISEYSSSSTQGDDEDDEQFNKEKRLNPAELDIWSLIASQPQQHEDKSAAPYVHPMLKRSASTLSQRSLQVCTESLGSETGSDDFSYEDLALPQHHQQQQQTGVVDFDVGYDYEDVKVVKYKMGAVGRKLPPPLPCTSLRMKPRREDGRLVLEAVSVSSQNNFKAERQDGRLLLTFVNPQQQQANNQQDEQNAYDYQTPKVRVIEHHRLALMMNKSAPINNPTHQVFKFQEEETCLLPPTPPAAELLNGYDYCWRAKPTAAQAMEKNSNSKHLITKNNTSIIPLPLPDQQQKSAMTKKKAGSNYNLKGCKNHHTRSFFWDWDPYSIATATS